MRFFLIVLLFLAGLTGFAGCSSEDALKHGQSTALDSVDMTSMTDQMARSLTGDSKIREIAANEGKLTVVMTPAVNELTGEILPAGQAELFTARVRALLSQHAKETFIFCIERDMYYRLRQREIGIDLGPVPDRVQPKFAFTATFKSLTDETRHKRTSYYLCVYELTRLDNGLVVWSDRYEVKKQIFKDMFDN
jgi:PBP1b-binding outer membrane lipoprotein LpoB